MAYDVYLRVRAGTWNAWASANQVGWGLHTVTPLQALKTTYWAAFQHPFSADTAFEFQLEIAAEAVMVLAALAFLCWRRWPEAVYCGLPAVVVGTQTWYQSGPRTLLLLFPVCIALARLEARRSWVRYLYFGISAPLAAVVGLMFLSGQFAGLSARLTVGRGRPGHGEHSQPGRLRTAYPGCASLRRDGDPGVSWRRAPVPHDRTGRRDRARRVRQPPPGDGTRACRAGAGGRLGGVPAPAWRG